MQALTLERAELEDAWSQGMSELTETEVVCVPVIRAPSPRMSLACAAVRPARPPCVPSSLSKIRALHASTTARVLASTAAHARPSEPCCAPVLLTTKPIAYDSGCNRTVIADATLSDSPIRMPKASEGCSVVVANGSRVPITGTGSLLNHDTQIHDFFNFNLISVHQTNASNDAISLFTSDTAHVVARSPAVDALLAELLSVTPLFTCSVDNGMYMVNGADILQVPPPVLKSPKSMSSAAPAPLPTLLPPRTLRRSFGTVLMPRLRRMYVICRPRTSLPRVPVSIITFLHTLHITRMFRP